MRRNSLATSLIAAAALGLSGLASAKDIGFLAAANGDVQIDNGTGVFAAAQRDGSVAIGDRIRTGLDSSAKIVLTDDTLLQIDEDTELRIETFHVGAAATKEVSILRQVRGRLRATVGDAFGGSTKIEVHTPTAAVGVKGTDFEVRKGSTSGEWEACLISGGIVVKNEYGTAEPRPGFCVVAYGDKAPGDPFRNPADPFQAGNGDDFDQPLDDDVAGGGDSSSTTGNDPTDPGNDPGEPYDDDELEDPFIPEFDPVDPTVDPDPPAPGGNTGSGTVINLN